MKIKSLLQLLAMLSKLVFYGIVLQCFFVSFLLAFDSEAQKIQSVKEVYVQFDFREASLKEVFKIIENKTGYSFAYEREILDKNIRLNRSYNAKTSLSDILLDISREASLHFKQINNNIIVDKIIRNQEIKDEIEVIIQTRNISGKVTSYDDGEALPGVNVVEKGTSNGTVTNVQGEYALEVAEGATLVFSSVGYTTEEVIVENQSVVDLVMTPDIQQLQELVVVGYGTQKKRDLTGSMTGVKEESFNQGIVAAPEQLMQGKLSGVNITLNSGRPGANSTVRIRGGTSISASNSPLYVIDGVPVAFSSGFFQKNGGDRMSTSANNPLNLLNPGDIESIDVLKDASAAAIYGSRGANGVILITTKKGKAGQTRLDYSNYIGVSNVRKKLDVLSADQYRNYLDQNAETIGEYLDGGTSTDWQDEIYQTALTHSHDVALSGGGGQTNYRASVHYLNQEGVIMSSRFEKLASRINVNHKTLNDRLSINLNLSNAFLNNDNAPNTNSAGGDTEGGIIRDALRFNPTFPVTNNQGEYTFLSIFNQNPVEQADLIDDETKTFRSLGNIQAEYEFTEWLKFNTNVGFTYETIGRNYYAPKASRIGAQNGGQASQESRENTSSLIETNLVLNKSFDKHAFTVLGGYSWQEFIYTDAYLRANNFVTDLTSFNNLDGAINFVIPQTGKASNKLISFYGRLNYDFDSRYLLTVSLRHDGSSRFGDNEKWGTFPSAAFAWRIIEEDFFTESNAISDLKLRVGYGITGNQEIGNYRSVPTLSAGSNKYIIGGEVVTAVGPNQLSNPNLKWEETTQTNFGIDFGFFGQRLSGSLDYYIKTTKDLLLTFEVPNPTEVNSTTANVGEVQNKGIEMELNGVLVENDNLNLNAYANFSRNRNEVVSLSNQTWKTDQIFTGGTGVPGFTDVTTQIILPGEPLGTFYGFEYIGTDENGVQQFTDINDDGQITPGEDRKVIGSTQPDYFYGFGTRGTYKRFNFDIFFRGVQGVDVLNATALDIQRVTNLPGFNVTEQAINDDIAYGQPAIYSSKWVQDATFLRLENLTIGYNFDVSSVAWVNNLRLYLTGQNLFVLTDYIGYDPEVDTRDMTTYPRPTTVMLGLNVQF